MENHSVKIVWSIVGCIAVISVADIVIRSWAARNVPIIFSPPAILQTVWINYKANYLNNGTSRTVDPDRGDITTSEGESYTMLRAVWLDDHPTFDASWKWTQANLQIKNGYLFSWLYGKRPDGTYGILTDQNGQNTASDADTDIALALLFAYSRWREPQYLASAEDIANAIWTNEVIIIGGHPYLAADNVEKKSAGDIAIDPSYFAPYAYRIFESVDPSHDWNGLVDTSYDVLTRSMYFTPDSNPSVGLPPDWIIVNRANGSLSAPSISPGTQGASLDTNYGYDALRVPWRMSLDWSWYADPRAKNILLAMSFLRSQWQSAHALDGIYAHDGSVVQEAGTPAMYGGSIGAFMIAGGDEARQVYDTKLVSLFDPDANSWKMKLDYYDDNWAWFGIGLYNGLLPNLWTSVSGTG